MTLATIPKRFKKYVHYSTLFLLLVLISCGNKQEKFCSCLNAGEALNNYAQKMLKEELTSAKVKKLTELRQMKKEACNDFETMAGDQLLQLKAACKNKHNN
jgi:hypothetical protein